MVSAISTLVGEELEGYGKWKELWPGLRLRLWHSFRCSSSCERRGGCIYAATFDGRVLKINTTNNSHCIIGNTVESNYNDGSCWGNGILGIDGCIYWPPADGAQILKYDPHLNLTSLVGGDLGRGGGKWRGGCTTSDGVIHFPPCDTNRILVIYPFERVYIVLEEQHGGIYLPYHR